MTRHGIPESDRRNPLINCEYVPLPMRIVGADGVTLCANRHFIDLVGDFEEINILVENNREDSCQLLPGNGKACPGCALGGVNPAENVWAREAEFPHLPGRSFRIYTQSVCGTNGEVIALMEVVTEITDINSLVELFNVLSDPIYLVDSETGRFLEANVTGCKQLGYSREELLTMTLGDVDPRIETDSIDQILSKLKETNSLILETVNRDARGVDIPVEVNMTLIHHQGKAALLGVSRNIAARKETERLRNEARNRERVILDNIPFAAWMKNREGRYVAVNRMFLQQSGFAEEEVLTKSDLDLWPADVALRFWRQTEAVLQTGEPSMIEDRIQTRTGVFEVLLIRSPLLDDAGEITGIVGIAQDI